ncbi:BTB/POZ domain-containing protein 2-like [Cimex lectularius]|uniref:BTB domain-containing protein n=1 Tax=Cimex lectularius TaxID=79782 RepID=A0A8I6RGA7_CIMLE|nr:BTB/POZ domain-containing protein 2-like [Cimex lectularius]
MDDWQNNVKSLAQRAKFLLHNQILCDCTFLLSGEEIKCHKLFLASTSPVFYTMFYGQLPQPDKPIIITDIEENIFHDMLGYIYEDKLELTNYKHACQVYNAAQKYIILPLQQSCLMYMKKCLNHENVIHLYEFAKFHGEDDLAKHCLKEIQLNTSNILQSKAFCYASFTTLNTILDLNRLNISSEMELIKAIDKWANFNSSKKDTMSPKIIANELITKLRLLTVSQNEFFTGISDSRLLNDSEKLAVLMRIIKPDFPPMENGLCEKKIKRKPCKAKSISTLDIQDQREARFDGSEWFTSIFTVNTSIDLIGVVINLQINDMPGEYKENIMVKVGMANSQDYFTEGSLYGHVKYNSKAEILFNTISTLDPFKEYSMHIFLCTSGIYAIGTHSQRICKDANVEIDFLSHSSWERSHPWNTTVLSSIIYTDPI